MTNTTKTVVIASAASTVSSAIIGILCYVKGKKDGKNEERQALLGTAAQSSTSTEQRAQA